MQAISYFRQTWALFFLVPPATADITARVPDISLLGFAIDARVFAGFLIFAGRFIDSFTDPIIGWWSDRTRSRWGRRIPFILFSTPFYALFAALLWILPSENPSLWNAIYFVIILELFFTAATMSSGPLEALVPEVTRGASDRMNLVGLIFLFAILGALIGLGGGGILIDAFDFRITGIILAVIGLTFRYLSLAAIWQHAPRHTPPAQVNFPRALRDTLRNPQFVYYLPTFVMFTTGVGIMMAWVPFFHLRTTTSRRRSHPIQPNLHNRNNRRRNQRPNRLDPNELARRHKIPPPRSAKPLPNYLDVNPLERRHKVPPPRSAKPLSTILGLGQIAGRKQTPHLRPMPNRQRRRLPPTIPSRSILRHQPDNARHNPSLHSRPTHGRRLHAPQGPNRRHRRLRRPPKPASAAKQCSTPPKTSSKK